MPSGDRQLDAAKLRLEKRKQELWKRVRRRRREECVGAVKRLFRYRWPSGSKTSATVVSEGFDDEECTATWGSTFDHIPDALATRAGLT